MKERIRQFRKEQQMSQQQLAVRLGTSVATVFRWEAGRAHPSQLALDALKRLGFKE